MPLHEALRAERLVIVGDPGSGKTTFLHRVAHALCQTLLGESRVVMLLPVVQRETQQGWLEYAKRVTCRELREELSGCRPGDLPGEGSDYGLVHLKVNFEARLGDSDRSWVEQARVKLSKSPEDLLTDTELLVELSRLAVLV